MALGKKSHLLFMLSQEPGQRGVLFPAKHTSAAIAFICLGCDLLVQAFIKY
jgi:hypothetical protein